MATAETRQIALTAPDNAASAVGLWIAALDDTRRRTLDLLEGLDPELVDPRAKSLRHTIGSLLYHIALIEVDWLYVEIREEEFPEEVIELFPWDARDAQGALTHVSGVSLEDHLRRLARVREMLRETLLNMTDEQYRAVREIPGAIVSTAWVVNHLMQHEAEHRGEIGQILDVLSGPTRH